MLELRQIICSNQGCGEALLLCSGCDRGKRYCSNACRDASRQSNLRKARRKYAHSDRGRENNRRRQRRFRAKRSSRKRNGSVFSSERTCVELAPCTEMLKDLRDVTGGFGATFTLLKSRQGHLGLRSAAVDQGSASRLSPHRKRAKDGEIRRCDGCGVVGRVRLRAATRGRFRWQGDPGQR